MLANKTENPGLNDAQLAQDRSTTYAIRDFRMYEILVFFAQAIGICVFIIQARITEFIYRLIYNSKEEEDKQEMDTDPYWKILCNNSSDFLSNDSFVHRTSIEILSNLFISIGAAICYELEL